MTHECTKMAQKWALLDFGEDHGLDIVETIHIEYPPDRRWELRLSLSNEDFNFRDGAEVMYSTMVNVSRDREEREIISIRRRSLEIWR